MGVTIVVATCVFQFTTEIAAKVAICVCGRVGNLSPLRMDDGPVDPANALEVFLRKPLSADLFFRLTVAGHAVSASFGWMLGNSPHVVSTKFDDATGEALDIMLSEFQIGHAENRTWLPTMLVPGPGTLDVHGKLFKFFLVLAQWASCVEDVKVLESKLQAFYTHVAFTRLDLVWMADHPPLHILHAARCQERRPTIWGLDGEEYGGINDRYLLVERPGLDAMGNIFAVFSNFHHMDALQAFVRSHGLETPARSLGSERLLLHALLFLGFCVRRMTPVAATVHAEPAWQSRYKYELITALSFAKIQWDGGTWEVNPEDAYLFGARCAGIPSECCSSTSLRFGGHIHCWAIASSNQHIYSLQRCCQRHYVAVTLRPSRKAVAYLNSSTSDSRNLQRDRLQISISAPTDLQSNWKCVPFSPDNYHHYLDLTAKARSLHIPGWLTGVPAGAVQCYSVDKLID